MLNATGADRVLEVRDGVKLYFHVSCTDDPCTLKYCSIRDGRWQSTISTFEYRMPALSGTVLTEANIRSAMETGLELLERSYREKAVAAQSLANAFTVARAKFSDGEAAWHTPYGTNHDPMLEQYRTLGGTVAALRRRSAEKPWTLRWGTRADGTPYEAVSRTPLVPVAAQGWADEILAGWADGPAAGE